MKKYKLKIDIPIILYNEIEMSSTLEELTNIIKKGKTLERDDLNNELIRNGGDDILNKIYQLICSTWREESIPTEWKEYLKPIKK